jgi:hypothetical protein
MPPALGVSIPRINVDRPSFELKELWEDAILRYGGDTGRDLYRIPVVQELSDSNSVEQDAIKSFKVVRAGGDEIRAVLKSIASLVKHATSDGESALGPVRMFLTVIVSELMSGRL